MNRVNMFLCTWWKEGKFSRTVRANTLKDLRRNLACRRENRHVYLHLGTIPVDAKDREVEAFMKDVQLLLKEKYKLEGKYIEYETAGKT